MKSKYILGLSISAILALTGCSASGNEAAVIDKLSHQLDRVTNTVVSVTNPTSQELSSSKVTEIISKTAPTKISTLSGAAQKTKHSLKNISLDQDKIVAKIKAIKRQIVDIPKLNQENSNAINELTLAMQRWTNSLSKTKTEFRNTVRGLYKLPSENKSLIKAKLARLSGCIQARETYIDNILTALQNIEEILNDISLDSTKPEQTNNPQQNQIEENLDNQKIPQDDKILNQDIQHLENSSLQEHESQENEKTLNKNQQQALLEQSLKNENATVNPQQENKPEKENQELDNIENKQPVQEGQPANWKGYNPYNGANGFSGYNGVNNYGINGNGIRGGALNPNRNTDTYGPGITNIDTYRYNGNGEYYGIGQGSRHYNGSNGVNEIKLDEVNHSDSNNSSSEQPITENTTESHNEIDIDTTNNIDSNLQTKDKNTDKTEIDNLNQEENLQSSKDCQKENTNIIIENQSKNIKKKIDESSTAPDKKIRPANTLTENKVKSVQAEKQPAKGHTQTINSLDINKKIHDLINS